jgi:hypothetical protein
MLITNYSGSERELDHHDGDWGPVAVDLVADSNDDAWHR